MLKFNEIIIRVFNYKRGKCDEGGVSRVVRENWRNYLFERGEGSIFSIGNDIRNFLGKNGKVKELK